VTLKFKKKEVSNPNVGFLTILWTTKPLTGFA
jgi:hypothetical protein